MLGAVIAMDVLEHGPNYYVIVRAMVDSLRVRGLIIESTPFGKALTDGREDLCVHLGTGGANMEMAMGQRMTKIGKDWVKIFM